MGTVIFNALSLWPVLAALAVVNGIARERLLEALLGERLALPLSGVILSALIFLATYLALPFLKPTKGSYWTVGAMWLALTVAFELIFGHFAEGETWSELMKAYDPRSGNLWTLVLLTVLISPYLAARLRGYV